MPNLLYIHHAKDFQSNGVYLSDDFFLANRSLFGAQEMDSWAGFRIVARLFNTYRLQISTNLSAVQLVLPDGQTLDPVKVDLPKSLKAKFGFEYLKVLLKYMDTSLSLYASEGLKMYIDRCIQDFGINFIWTDTQFYDCVIPSKMPNIIRSVNFEPLHVLREDPTLFRYLRLVGKLCSESKIARLRNIVAISPVDAALYQKLSIKNQISIPLRQLGFLLDQYPRNPSLPFNGSPYFYFAGSTFDVKHNRDNLDLIVEQVAPALLDLDPNIQILIFGHRFPSNLKLPSNVRHMNFRADFYDLASASIGSIVPGKGGAGMQSKIFEPLCMGVPLVANERALAGYPFNSREHFWKGNSAAEIIGSIKTILDNPESAERKSQKAKLVALSIFPRGLVSEQIETLIKDYSETSTKKF